ncbi:hypothetical protein CRENBAI_024169 [Crenichthys baileyi]|uniref:Uncharacterized protein n=1 Tax=Crenichthys baileyi TaxID=28760 RepID=A0AAV9S2Y3_9TELE
MASRRALILEAILGPDTSESREVAVRIKAEHIKFGMFPDATAYHTTPSIPAKEPLEPVEVTWLGIYTRSLASLETPFLGETRPIAKLSRPTHGPTPGSAHGPMSRVLYGPGQNAQCPRRLCTSQAWPQFLSNFTRDIEHSWNGGHPDGVLHTGEIFEWQTFPEVSMALLTITPYIPKPAPHRTRAFSYRR